MRIHCMKAQLRRKKADARGGQLFASSRHARQIRRCLNEVNMTLRRNVRRKDGTRHYWTLRDSRTSQKHGFSKLLSFWGVEDWHLLTTFFAAIVLLMIVW